MDRISIGNLRTDGGTQARIGTYPDVVREYAEAMAAGAVFPPVLVFFDGIDSWLADGFHRVEAAIKAEIDEIDAEVRQGSQRDAVFFAIAANGLHGLRRTNGDKGRAVEMMLKDKEWGTWSDRKIADHCGVSHTFVSKTREAVYPPAKMATGNRCQSSHTGRDGREYTMNLSPKPVQKQLFKFCERCQRVGQVAGCETCNQLNERQEPVEEMEQAASPAPAEPQPNSSPAFDWPGFRSAIAQVSECQTDLCMACPGEEKSSEYQEVSKKVSQLTAIVHGWENRLTG